TAKNSADVNDLSAPVLADPQILNQSATQLALALSATDASNDVFYYIEDAANAYAEVLLGNQISLPLAEGTNYNFRITAIDFSGNESEAKTVSVTGQAFECNNLLAGKTLLLGTGDLAPYFAPNWVANTNYSVDVNGDNISFNLDDATYDQIWQAQFRITVETPLVVTPEQSYSLLMDVTSNNNTPFYAKFFDKTDSQMMEICGMANTVAAGTATHLAAYDITCPAGLTQISQILFAFGGNPANTQIQVSDISVCGEASLGIIKNIDAARIALYPNPASGKLVVSGLAKPAQATVSDLTGKTVLSQVAKDEINVAGLSSGVYFLKINNQTIKFIKK
ncbi:MAG: T9SS type A sorting domain-containing protein, partial [Candidatus Symbiothrix sp.]|nr:T9SS type A sorting domain-containing protein [Candidatus Symbiothrix sp.]